MVTLTYQEIKRQKIAVWKPVEYEGMEYLQIYEHQSMIMIFGDVIGVENQSAFRIDYHLMCKPDFSVMSLHINTQSRIAVDLRKKGDGSWTDSHGKPLPELEGCIDVDISATPFTNTLPIRRVQWQIGQSEVFKMVYILVPDLKVSVDRQRYTCLDKTEQGATFRYESVDSDFTAVLTVDSDGLVLNYPGLFERVI